MVQHNTHGKNTNPDSKEKHAKADNEQERFEVERKPAKTEIKLKTRERQCNNHTVRENSS